MRVPAKAARESFQVIDGDAAVETLAGNAMSRFLPASEPPGEWDMDGPAPGDAIGISLPINQWREAEPTEEETADFERRAATKSARGPRQAQSQDTPPVEVVASSSKRAPAELLDPQPEDETPATSRFRTG